MNTTLFISDLHLSAERPEISALFLDFLHHDAAQGEALYILGDLFEVWLGDDAILPVYTAVLTGLRDLTQKGIPVYVMHGNRDFLLGSGFEQASACHLLPDPTVIDLYGEATLLMHGDLLCVDDVDYQRFRVQVRDPETQRQFLSLPIEQRIQVAQQYRTLSRDKTRLKPQEIMDVSQTEVLSVMQRHGVKQLIHGHTHRPAVHALELNKVPARRIVLGDWYDQGSLLMCDRDGCRLLNLPLTH